MNQVCALADNCSSRAHNSCGITWHDVAAHVCGVAWLSSAGKWLWMVSVSVGQTPNQRALPHACDCKRNNINYVEMMLNTD